MPTESNNTPTTPTQVGLRIYHEFERPRNGRLILVPSTSADISSPTVHGSTIVQAAKNCTDTTRYEPHIFSATYDCFMPVTHTDDSTEYVAEAMDTGTKTSLQYRLDVKMMSLTKGSPASDGLSSRLVCDSSSTMLSGGWFGIGIIRGKTASNHGTLWRTALQLGAALTFTIGKRYEGGVEGRADIFKTHRQVPCVGYENVEGFFSNSPVDAQVVVIEYGGESLETFEHPKRALYVLGSEDNGVPPLLVRRAHKHVAIPTAEGRPDSLNVAAAGAIVMYDRFVKMGIKQGRRQRREDLKKKISIKEQNEFDTSAKLLSTVAIQETPLVTTTTTKTTQ